ncbi:hypothetical protein AEB_P0337 [Altererythrobacter sp. B11]|uniref:hypothetical protein n=1 Tax=Altererythrobacter sp. B11 TaxID=2060312 RepID=UPI000DC741C4|nr:hypothetical protein [Altererythrobacter sp. B11]BBC71205.1 hypothetical protein AEB_P0337 [Altererythrobacter sp. B11]
MAGFSQDSDETDGRGAAAPLSQHPAFTLIIALWFAALLGLGCMVIPGVVLERIVIASRLPELFPMAAPPLGTTARLLLAITAAIGGALLGMMIAGRLASAQSIQRRHRRIATRPINSREELGEEGLGPNLEESPTLPMAPAASWLSLRHPRPQDAPEPEADEPTAPAITADITASAAAASGSEWPVKDDEDERPDVALPLAFAEADEPISPSLASPPETPSAGEGQAATWQNAPLAELGLVQLVQRLGHSLDRRREWLARCEAEEAESRAIAQALAEAAARAEAAGEPVYELAYQSAEDAPAPPANPFLDLAARLQAEPDAVRRQPVSTAEPSPDPKPIPPRVPEDPEAALRTALATLQRMSGAS